MPSDCQNTYVDQLLKIDIIVPFAMTDSDPLMVFDEKKVSISDSLRKSKCKA